MSVMCSGQHDSAGASVETRGDVAENNWIAGRASSRWERWHLHMVNKSCGSSRCFLAVCRIPRTFQLEAPGETRSVQGITFVQLE